MTTFKAYQVSRDGDAFTGAVVERSTEDLPAGELLIDVQFSSLNYKDALSATGNPGVTRNFPHTPGIDAAGLVVESSDAAFAPGDAVIVIGFDLGMGTSGGFAERIRVPAGWAVPLPAGFDLEGSMLLGTAGFTAALALDKLERAGGLTPAQGPVLVSGASGGVGSVAVALLAQLGYEVVAVSGKPEQQALLLQLGASTVLPREALLEGGDRPLLKETYAGAIDTVGGDMLFNAVRSLRYGGSLAACGLVASPQIPATVLPFILRHVNLLGVDSVQLPLAEKARIWNRLAADWQLGDRLEPLKTELTLDTIGAAIERIFQGRMVGRGVLRL
ncbi:MAG: YhdH/YhfP family quinone oxidoreductase [Pseudomonadota bacterium]